MADGFLQARRTIHIDATGDGLAFFAHDAASTDGTLPRHAEGPTVRALHLDAHDFWNHIAAAFHHDGVADLQPEARDFVFVMERGPGYGNASDYTGRKLRDRGERARAAHLNRDVRDFRLDLARCVLERNGPAGRLRGITEPALLLEAVDL